MTYEVFSTNLSSNKYKNEYLFIYNLQQIESGSRTQSCEKLMSDDNRISKITNIQLLSQSKMPMSKVTALRIKLPC